MYTEEIQISRIEYLLIYNLLISKNRKYILEVGSKYSHVKSHLKYVLAVHFLLPHSFFTCLSDLYIPNRITKSLSMHWISPQNADISGHSVMEQEVNYSYTEYLELLRDTIFTDSRNTMECLL